MLLLFIACFAQPTAELTAIVSDSSGTPLSNVTIEIKDALGDSYSTGQSDFDGRFIVALPPLETFFTILSVDGYPNTAFTGFAGEGQTEYPEGYLRLRSHEEVSTDHALYQGCEQTDLPAIEGETRVAIPGQQIESLPIIRTGRATASNESQVLFEACYYDSHEGIPEFGESGRYLIPNLSEGIHELDIIVQYDSETEVEYTFFVYVPEDGIAPLLPTLIPL